MNKMTPEEIMSELGLINLSVQSGLWRQCELVFIAHTQHDKSWNWATDISEKLGVLRQAVYDRKNAYIMRQLFEEHIGKRRTDSAARRGYSFFTDVYNYRKEASLEDLLEAIEIASNKLQLRIYLQGRYGNSETQETFVSKSFKKLSLIFGLLETHKAPDSVRFAIGAALESIEEWQITVNRNEKR
jgi:hypothetical protein